MYMPWPTVLIAWITSRNHARMRGSLFCRTTASIQLPWLILESAETLARPCRGDEFALRRCRRRASRRRRHEPALFFRSITLGFALRLPATAERDHVLTGRYRELVSKMIHQLDRALHENWPVLPKANDRRLGHIQRLPDESPPSF